jgi:hypothetical protein
MGDEQENGACWRFLQRFEQRIRSMSLQIVHAIDQDHTAAAHSRRGLEQPPDASHLIGRYAAREPCLLAFLVLLLQSLKPDEIGVRAAFHQAGRLAARRREALNCGAVQGIADEKSGGKILGYSCLPYPFRASEYPAMVQPIGPCRRYQFSQLRIMPDPASHG